ncbi:hypothetical protein PO909_008828 [Leuciscus waleckii]
MFSTVDPGTFITSKPSPVDKQPFVTADFHERRCLESRLGGCAWKPKKTEWDLFIKPACSVYHL